MPYLTNSQAQLLEDIVGIDPNFIEHPGAPVDNGAFVGHVTNSYNEFPQHQLTDQPYHPSGYAVHHDQSHLPVNTNSSVMNVCEIPAMEMWPGHLNFTVEFSKAQDKTKATPWIVSFSLLSHLE